MNLIRITQPHVSFDPLKPVILRGPPDEDAHTVFSGNVVLSLPRPTKISSVSVTLKSTATTYWPEGIGDRGTRLTAEKSLGEKTVQILQPSLNKEERDKDVVQLPAGTHRFPFMFLVPNSVVETIEDQHGRVRHVVEARVTRPGIQLLNSWGACETVLVLRTYMSNSLLTNNSIQDLSRTLEKKVTPADVQIIVEQAAFSSGDAFHIRIIIQPHRKNAQLESMQVFVVERYHYQELEMRASRSGKVKFPLEFKASTEVSDSTAEPQDTTHLIRGLFEKGSNRRPVHLHDTIAHRLTFTTPTCEKNIHHSTSHLPEIQFYHHLIVKMSLSYPSAHPSPSSSSSTPAISRSNSSDSVVSLAEQSNSATYPPGNAPSWQSMFSKLRITRSRDKTKGKRQCDMLTFQIPVTVFDCRLKEDFGRLPSYFDIDNTNQVLSSSDNVAETNEPGDVQFSNISSLSTPSSPTQGPPVDKPYIPPHTFLCPCYYAFAEQMQRASQHPYLVTSTTASGNGDTTSDLGNIPSIPPPEYMR